jgi:hypothetical protein
MLATVRRTSLAIIIFAQILHNISKVPRNLKICDFMKSSIELKDTNWVIESVSEGSP